MSHFFPEEVKDSCKEEFVQGSSKDHTSLLKDDLTDLMPQINEPEDSNPSEDVKDSSLNPSFEKSNLNKETKNS
jgi:hypothetical protein